MRGFSSERTITKFLFKKILILISIIFVFTGLFCNKINMREAAANMAITDNENGNPAVTNAKDVKQLYRPQIHFTEKDSWINDPNGLVYDAYTGSWHMFYQFRDYQGARPVHWGHAKSNNLVDWENKGVVISPDKVNPGKRGDPWSGSCVIDENNTSGLFPDNVPKESRIVALYTYDNREYSHTPPTVGLAYTIDHCETFTIRDGVVIDNKNSIYGMDFRDPKVIWVENKALENGGTWLMSIGGWTQLRLFTSPNLIDWTFNSEVKDYYGKVIESECPDFFPLAVDGDENNKKWVVTLGGTAYALGLLLTDADGLYYFKAQTPTYKIYNVSNPFANTGEMYATQSYYNDKYGRRILVSWMQDSDKSELLGKSWTGAQSLPLETKLKTINGMLSLNNYPVEEINSLRESEKIFETKNQNVEADEKNILENCDGRVFDIEAVIDVSSADAFGFKLRAGDKHKFIIKYDVKKQVLTVDATKAGKALSYTLKSALAPINGKITLRIIIDESVFDIFGNGGQQSFHGFIFPDANSISQEFFVEIGSVKIESMNIWSLRSMI